MANRRRGEVSLVLAGHRYTLCLTLGALADLEDALRAGDLAGLSQRLAAGRPRTADLIALLGAALRGGGHALTDADVRALPLAGDMDALVEALAEVLEAAFGAGPSPHPEGPGGKPASSRPRPHPEVPASAGLEGGLQPAPRSLEPTFEAANAAPQDEGANGIGRWLGWRP